MKTETEHAKLLKEMLGVPFSIIPPRPVIPLWPHWIARRHVTLVVAPGGTGKGLLTIDMAARVTTGRPFPGEPEGTVHTPEAVVLIAPEDDPNEAVAWRLEAAGADTSLVYNLTVKPDGTPFRLPDHVTDGTLSECIKQVEKTGVKVGLVVIDPLFACVSKPLTTNPAARKVIDPLEMLARSADLAVVLTHHTVKSGATAGSKGLTDAVRCVLRIERPDSDSSWRVLSVEKANNAADSGTIRYLISGDEGDENSTCLVWPVEVEQLAAVMSSRGYVIDPDMEQEPESPTQPGDVQLGDVTVELFQTDGGSTAKSLGKFADADNARTFAQQRAKLVLKWKEGPVEGSFGAATRASDGTFTFYSVMPVELCPS